MTNIVKRFLVMFALSLCCGVSLYAQWEQYIEGINSTSDIERGVTQMEFQNFIIRDPLKLTAFLKEVKQEPNKLKVLQFFRAQMIDYVATKSYPIPELEFDSFMREVINIPGMEKYYDDMFVEAASAGETRSFRILTKKVKGIGASVYSFKSTAPIGSYSTTKSGITVEMAAIYGVVDNMMETSSKDFPYYRGLKIIEEYFKGNKDIFVVQDIIDNMTTQTVLNGDFLALAIKQNPDIYSDANVKILLNSIEGAPTLALAKDYASRVKKILEIKGTWSDNKETQIDLLLTTRLYKVFIQRAKSIPKIAEMLKFEQEAIGSFESENEFDKLQMELGSLLYITTSYFLYSKDGRISTPQETALFFGTLENEREDALPFLAVAHDEYSGVLQSTMDRIQALKVLVLCNNPYIINEQGVRRGIVAYLTEDCSVPTRNNGNRIVSLEDYNFGSLTGKNFEMSSLPVMSETNEDIIRSSQVSSENLTKGLEVLKAVEGILKK